MGAAAVSLLMLLDFLAADLRAGWVWPEILVLNLLGSAPEFIFRPAFFLFSQHGYLYLIPVALLVFWKPTRRLALAGLRVAVWLFAAWVAAMACATAYALDHTRGFLPGLVALPIAILLSRWRRWRLASTFVLTGGFALGTLLAQGFYSLPFQDAFRHFVNPAWGFVPPVVGSVVAALWLSFRRAPRGTDEPRPTAASSWGLITCSLACVVFVGAELRGVRVQQPEPVGSRILDDWAYDIYVTGDPPQLVWTDRKQIHVLTDPYGEKHERYTVDDDAAYYVERIWPSPTGGFYIQGVEKLEWWAAPAAGERLSYRPAWRYQLPPWLTAHSSTTWSIAEDPPTGRLFTAGEYYSRYIVIDRATSKLVASGTISNTIWPFWSFTIDSVARVLYATSALDDGGLYVMDVDSLVFARKASHLYVYETVLDAEQNLLWGVRPLTGEVVAVDTRSYEMRYRVAVQFGLRDLQRDPESGDLYTCSEFFGDIFRVDAQTRTASRIGWCGRLCRDMYLDAPRHGLWVATRDGICHIDTSRLGAPAAAPRR